MANARACCAIASDAGRGSHRPQKGPRSSPCKSLSAFSAAAAFSARWSTGQRVPTRSRCGQWSSATVSSSPPPPPPSFRGDVISSRRAGIPPSPSSAAVGLRPATFAAGASVPLVAMRLLADPTKGESRAGGNGDWYWLGDDGEASTETAPVRGHRAGVMLTSSAWFRPANPAGVLAPAIGRCGIGPRRLCRMVLPKNCSSMRTAPKHSPPVLDSLKAVSRFAPSASALRMRLALPWLTLRPRLLLDRSGSTTLRYLRAMGRWAGLGSPGLVPASLAVTESFPYLSIIRHIKSGVSSAPSA